MAISNSLLGKLLRITKRGHGREDIRKNGATDSDRNGLRNIPEVYPSGSRCLSAQVAAVKSLCPSQKIPLDAHRRTFSEDFRYGSPDLDANRRRLSRKPSVAQLSTSFSNGDLIHSIFELSDHSSVNQSNTDVHTTRWREPRSLSPRHSPMSLQIPKKAILPKRPVSMCSPIFAYEERRSSLSRKPDVSNLRIASDSPHVRSFSLPVRSNNSRPQGIARSPITRADLDKPLPPVPLGKERAPRDARGAPRDPRRSVSDMLPPMDQHLQLSPRTERRHSNSDTTYYRTWSPAVTHETITQQIHEIREEYFTQNIHEHDVFYRTLPVVDVEVLPARHYVPSESGLIEIAEEDVPADMRPSDEWIRTHATESVLQNERELDDKQEAAGISVAEANVEAAMSTPGIMQAESTYHHPAAVGPAIPGAERLYAVSIDASGWHQDS